MIIRALNSFSSADVKRDEKQSTVAVCDLHLGKKSGIAIGWLTIGSIYPHQYALCRDSLGNLLRKVSSLITHSDIRVAPILLLEAFCTQYTQNLKPYLWYITSALTW